MKNSALWQPYTQMKLAPPPLKAARTEGKAEVTTCPRRSTTDEKVNSRVYCVSAFWLCPSTWPELPGARPGLSAKRIPGEAQAAILPVRKQDNCFAPCARLKQFAGREENGFINP